jgi:predicted nucleic acid-binding protein
LIHLDTNALIELPKRLLVRDDVIALAIEAGELLACSSLVWFEFCLGPLTESHKRLASGMLNGGIVDCDTQIAKRATHLFDLCGRRRQHKIDCLIAATAIQHNAPLITRHVDDFAHFQAAGLQLR